MSEPTAAANAPVKKPPPTRSPSFPFVDLETALDRAEKFRLEEGRNSARPEVAVTHWEYSAKSSGGKQMLAALRAFGLLEGEGMVKLTDAAYKILIDKRPDSLERDALVREAALRPAIHRQLWEEYGAAPPSDLNLRHELLIKHAFNENSVDNFLREYKRTVAFAKLGASGSMSPQPGDQSQNTPVRGVPMPPQIQPLAGGSAHQAKPPAIVVSDELPPVTFPLPRGNAIEIRLRSKVTAKEFTQLTKLFQLLKPSLVEGEMGDEEEGATEE